MFALLSILLGTAGAHPMGSSLVGHRLDVVLAPPSLLVDYTVEIPTTRALRALREAGGGHLGDPAASDAAIASVTEELGSGLRLLVNEKPVLLHARAPSPAPGGDSRFIRFTLYFDAGIPADARTLQLVLGSLPDEPALFLSSVHVSDAVMIDDLDLFDVVDGRLRRDLDDQWRMEEEARNLRISFRLRPAWWSRVREGLRVLAGASGPLPAAAAWQGEADPTWLRWAPEGMGAGLLGLLAAGLGIALRSRWQRTQRASRT